MNVYEGNEKYIFISYAHKDSKTVLPILEELIAKGHRVWYDSGIEAGTEWPENIETHLLGSACVIAFMSENSVASRNCRNEITFALHNGIEVIVVYLENIAPARGMGLQLEVCDKLFMYKYANENVFLADLFAVEKLQDCLVSSEELDTICSQGTKRKFIKAKKTSKKQKFLVWGSSIVATVIVILVFCFSSIFHTHNMGDWIIDKEPGIEKEGSRYKVCSICGKRGITEELPELDVKCSINQIDQTCTIFEIAGEYVTNLVIPSQYQGCTITEIADNAFTKLPDLVSLTYPSTITTINKFAKYGKGDYWHESNFVSNLQTVFIPFGVQSIGDDAFSGCYNLASITIPDSITSIGQNAFSECSSLTNITIPESVCSIGSGAFYGCTNLTSIIIPNSVTIIGKMAFYGCISLANITVDGENAVYHSKGNCLIETSTGVLILGCKNSAIPVDGSITSIGEYAFCGCAGLTSIVIPNSITSIGEYAFYDCNKLVEVYNLSTIEIGGESDGGVGDYVKVVHTSLEEKSIIDEVQGYLFIEDQGTVYLLGYIGNETELTLPSEYLGQKYSLYQYAFSDCRSLVGVTISEGVTSINNFAFYDCDDLVRVSISNSVVDMGSHTFWDCDNLTSVTIPASIANISSGVFKSCNILESIYYDGTMAEWQAIPKDSLWDDGTGDYTVYCTDAVVHKDGSVSKR